MANYPVPYQNNWNYSGVGQQMYPQYQQSMNQMPVQQTSQTHNGMGIKWVDGEVGAKAYQMPAGWPPNQPIDLWDTNDTVIYLKSINPMGMPNPLQKIHYTMEEAQRPPVSTQSCDGKPLLPSGDYVTRGDLEKLKEEIREALTSATDNKAVKSNGKSSV